MLDFARISGIVGVLAAIWSNAVSTGVIVLGALATIATLVGILYGAKWKSRWDQAQATIDLYRDNAQGHQDRAELATLALKDLAEKASLEKVEMGRQMADLREELGKLRALPSVAGLQDILTMHETRAQERHDQTVAVLGHITDRLMGTSR